MGTTSLPFTCSPQASLCRSDIEIPDYEPFHLESLDALRQEIERLGVEIPLTDSPAALTAPLALRSH